MKARDVQVLLQRQKQEDSPVNERFSMLVQETSTSTPHDDAVVEWPNINGGVLTCPSMQVDMTSKKNKFHSH